MSEANSNTIILGEKEESATLIIDKARPYITNSNAISTISTIITVASTTNEEGKVYFHLYRSNAFQNNINSDFNLYATNSFKLNKIIQADTINIDASQANNELIHIMDGLNPFLDYDIVVFASDIAGNFSSPKILDNIIPFPDDNDSKISQLVGHSDTIQFLNYTQDDLESSTGSMLMEIIIEDFGTSDGFPTILDSLEITIENHSYLKKLGIYNLIGTELGELSVNNTVSNSKMLFTDLNFSVPNGKKDTLVIRGSFNTTNIIDGDSITLELTKVGIPFQNSSIFSSSILGEPSNVISIKTKKIVDVTLSQLVIDSIQNLGYVNSLMYAKIIGTDIYDNVDKDFSGNLVASVEIGSGEIQTTNGRDKAELKYDGEDFSFVFDSLKINDGGVHKIRFEINASSATSPISIFSDDIQLIHNNSEVVLDSSFNYVEYFDYSKYKPSTIKTNNALAVAQVLVRDGGIDNKSDGLRTAITSIDFVLDETTKQTVNSLALFSGDVKMGEQQLSDDTVTFDFLELNPNGYSFIDDQGEATYTLYANFNQNDQIDDHSQLAFTLHKVRNILNYDDGNREELFSGIVDTTLNMSTPTGDKNILDVVATKIVFLNEEQNKVYERLYDSLFLN